MPLLRESSDRPVSLSSLPSATAPQRAAAEDLMRTCPNCGRELAERKCKLYCPDPRCGYFLSCADYY
ncbi:MAG TPA: hypothetical protein VGS22_06160 [Thermoanaerobaculia bacterium]|jgi:hypothetical protein|nr:hypothetical protein [Thermoanaerobaculia bacterium]